VSVATSEPPWLERSDAARNRRALLDAAAELIAESGPAALTMRGVAQRAGVGKATVSRRFGNRAGLMLALLDHSEEQLQSAVITGPPPLGPGADPIERLVAFGRAKLDLIAAQGDILAAAGAVFATGAYRTMLTHIQHLLRAADSPGDALLTAQMLAAGLDASLVLHQMRDQNVPLPRIADNWETVARQLAGRQAATPIDDETTREIDRRRQVLAETG
jgi:AcrR family transcriptional regulator